MSKKIDMHIHSHYDDGAEDMTVSNIIERAESKQLGGVGITLHYRQSTPDIEEYRSGFGGFCGDDCRAALDKLVEETKSCTSDTGLTLKVGIETEMTDLHGNLNAPPDVLKGVDFVLCSCHWIPDEIMPIRLTSLMLKDKARAIEYFRSEEWNNIIEGIGREKIIEKYFSMYKRALSEEYLTALGHPHFGGLASLGIVKSLEDVRGYLSDLAETMVKTNTGFNITEPAASLVKDPSLDDCGIEPDFWRSLPIWVNICKQKGVSFMPGSDAHNLEHVGGIEGCYGMIDTGEETR